MSRFNAFALLPLAFLAAGFSSAAAQKNPRRAVKPRAPKVRRPTRDARMPSAKELLKRFDTDRDGKLNEAELGRLLGALRKRAGAIQRRARGARGLRGRRGQGPAPAGPRGPVAPPKGGVKGKVGPVDPKGSGRGLPGLKRRYTDKPGVVAPFDRSAIRKRFDANRNGRLDPEERAGVLNGTRRRRGGETEQPRRKHLEEGGI